MSRNFVLMAVVCVACASSPPAADRADTAAAAIGETPAPSGEPLTTASHPRLLTIAALDSASAGRGRWLRADLKSEHTDRVRVGEEIAFEFKSDRAAHLTIVHVDGEGNLTLLVPNEENDGAIKAGQAVRFPPEDTFEVTLPIGHESVYAFATQDALTPAELGLGTVGDRYAVIDPVVGPDFARCLQSHLKGAGDRSAFARLDYAVEPEAGELPYTVATIEEYFDGPRMRSVSRPTFDLVIQFESGSSQLGKEATTQLDEIGKALAGKRLSAFTFQLDGHTDDVGAEGYNDALSQRRASAARDYLISRHRVDPAHLAAVGFGERRPKAPGTSREARDQNRRVELELKSRNLRSNPVPQFHCGP